MSMHMTGLWVYREPTWTDTALEGFKVEATDGSIGKVEEVGIGYLVVDTGPWIFGKKVMVPAGVVGDVDFDTEAVYVDRSKDELKNAPEFDENRYRDEGYRAELGGYYGEPAAREGRR